MGYEQQGTSVAALHYERGISSTSAEHAAMGKRIDINTQPHLAHGFVRYGPLSVKTNGNFQNVPDPSTIDPTIDRLTKILTYGILSHEFASRVGLKLSRNWNDKKNMRAVSLAGPSAQAFKTAKLLAVEGAIGVDQISIHPKDIFVAIITPSLPLADIRDELNDNAVFTRFRVKQRDVIGMVVDNSDEAITDTVRVMKDVYKDKPQLCIPLYDEQGTVLWPTAQKIC